MLKDKLWTRRVSIETEVMVLRGNQVVEETTLLDEIRRNQTTEQEVQKELKKNGQAWKDNRIVYTEEKSIFQITGRYESKSYKKTIN